MFVDDVLFHKYRRISGICVNPTWNYAEKSTFSADPTLSAVIICTPWVCLERISICRCVPVQFRNSDMWNHAEEFPCLSSGKVILCTSYRPTKLIRIEIIYKSQVLILFFSFLINNRVVDKVIEQVRNYRINSFDHREHVNYKDKGLRGIFFLNEQCHGRLMDAVCIMYILWI